MITILTWAFLGMISGSIVYLLDGQKLSRNGIYTIIAGVIGAVGGGWLADNLFGINNAITLSSLLIATTLGLVTAYIQRLILATQHINPFPTPKYHYKFQDNIAYNDIRGVVTKDRKDQLQELTNALSYPVSKSDLVSFVEKSQYSNSLFNKIESLPDAIYQNKEQLFQSLNSSL